MFQVTFWYSLSYRRRNCTSNITENKSANTSEGQKKKWTILFTFKKLVQWLNTKPLMKACRSSQSSLPRFMSLKQTSGFSSLVNNQAFILRRWWQTPVAAKQQITVSSINPFAAFLLSRLWTGKIIHPNNWVFFSLTILHTTWLDQ